ncbi:GNAT family N-acetyltransferase [Roseateles puraquae]|uniref:GNAT family N-acetyltransferase n=1 Tax=Roseateles puraquae TaxID=431059 RepID=UPI0031E42D39
MFLRRLNLEDPRDRQIAQELFLAAPEYEVDAFGRLPSNDMAQPLEGRFPSACAPEHRLTFAAFDHDRPLGLAQVALHMPSADAAALLLLLVPAPLRKQHVGCEIVERLSRQARRWPGISQWYLSVTDTNTGGLAFWRHCGFRTTATGLTAAGFTHTMHAMTRAVKQRPLCQRHGVPEDDAGVDARNLFARLR